MVTPVRASNWASGSRRTGWSQSVGFQKRPVPHFTCCLPAVTKTVRATSKLSQSWSSWVRVCGTVRLPRSMASAAMVGS